LIAGRSVDDKAKNDRGNLPGGVSGKQRRILVFSLLIALSLAFTSGHAGETHPPYTLVDPPIQVNDGKSIEVIEWFWYASLDSYQTSSMLAEWAKQLPDDIVLRRVPAILKDDWAILANVYLAFEQLDLAEEMHARVYHAVVKQGLNWSDERYLFDWVDRQGVDVATFVAAFRSDTVYEQRLRAIRLSESIGLQNVPAFLVQGRYLISAELADGIEHIPEILNQIIGEARGKLKTR